MEIGIDIGGNHIAIAKVKEDKILNQMEYDFVEQDKKNMKVVLIEKIEKGIKQLISKEKIDKIGICCCGTVTEQTIVKATNLNLYNFELVEVLKQKYSDTKILLRNDAKCAGLAEKKYGILHDYENAVFLTIGTGIGGALFIKGEIYEPQIYPGFEVGHTVIQAEGRPCSCGSKGCFEAYASIEALKQEVKRVLQIRENLTGKQTLELIQVEKNRPEIQKIIEEYTKYFSIGVSNLINLFEPDIIGIGGSFVYYKELLLPNIMKNLYLFNPRKEVNVQFAKFKNNAGIIGSII